MVLHKWATAIDKGLVNVVVLLELRKAFDIVKHTVLLEKLAGYFIACYVVMFSVWLCHTCSYRVNSTTSGTRFVVLSHSVHQEAHGFRFEVDISIKCQQIGVFRLHKMYL